MPVFIPASEVAATVLLPEEAGVGVIFLPFALRFCIYPYSPRDCDFEEITEEDNAPPPLTQTHEQPEFGIGSMGMATSGSGGIDVVHMGLGKRSN